MWFEQLDLIVTLTSTSFWRGLTQGALANQTVPAVQLICSEKTYRIEELSNRADNGTAKSL